MNSPAAQSGLAAATVANPSQRAAKTTKAGHGMTMLEQPGSSSEHAW